MGQYFTIFNIDKKEYLEPYWFGHGLTLPGIARTPGGVMAGLAILLACSGSGRYVDGPIYARWAGDRIAIVGDYFQGDVAGCPFDEDTWCRATDQQDVWVDISEHVRHTLESDWELQLPPPRLDGADPRSILHPDGTITAVPGPVWDEVSSTWLPLAVQQDGP